MKNIKIKKIKKYLTRCLLLFHAVGEDTVVVGLS
jgi:hypothetical protein